MTDPSDAVALLRRLAESEDRELPLAEAALAFAWLDRPDVDAAPYRRHLEALAEDVAREAAGATTLAGRAEALRVVLADHHGYRGDEETYDDLANADLMRVIDRRRGLPVTLGILYLHAARAQGWRAAGLSLPGHFVIGLEPGEDGIVLDPFNGGSVCGVDRLEALLGQTEPGAALLPGHLAPIDDRDVLLRLQNNIRSRLLEAGAADMAARVIERMLLLAPRRSELWREAGLVRIRLGHLAAAIESLENAIAFAPDSVAATEARALLRRVKGKLH